LFNSFYLIEIVDQQNFTTLVSTHGQFWIERIAHYFENKKLVVAEDKRKNDVSSFILQYPYLN
jgi:hypothetical protein